MDREPFVLPPPDPETEREARELAEHAPIPARIGGVRFGTAGWTDPTLVHSGLFYPPAAKGPAERLAHYASHFPLVEVDATYYAIPAPSVAERWVERTPDDFVFDIKAHPIVTGHPVARSRLPRDVAEALAPVRPDRRRIYPRDIPREIHDELVRRFRLVLDPLVEAGKLGCVMVQLPPWTTATRGAARSLERLPDILPEVTIAVEFRHPSWMEHERRARVFDLLRRNGLAYVVVDEPDVPGGGVPAIVQATRDDLALVRFHGHNKPGWRAGASVTERFNYLYSPKQMAGWTKPLRELSRTTSATHAVFNNCVRDFAVLNAKNLAALLVEGADSPPTS